MTLTRHSVSPAPIISAQTPATRRLAEFRAIIDGGSPGAILDFVAATYTPANLEREPIEARVGTCLEWHRRGGFTPLEVLESRDHYVAVRAFQPYSGEYWSLAIEVEPDEPHRIEAVWLGRAEMPVLVPAADDRAVAVAIIDHASDLAEAELFSGAVLVARYGEILAQDAFGTANRDFAIPNKISTRFNMASLSKSWTAVAMAQLVEQGAVSFEDVVAKFVDYPDREAAQRVRIKHLLSHTGGLGNYFTDKFDRTARKLIRSIDDYLALAQDQPIKFVPGERWDYSNAGMVLAGKIIECVTGRSYFEHMQDAVLGPAGMETAEFLELDRVNRDVAIGYTTRWTLNGPVVTNNLFENFIGGCPAGGGYGTVVDAYRFAEALLDGRLIAPETVELLTTAKPELNSPDYGYGFAVHAKRALFGHSGGMLGVSANLDIVMDPPGWVIAILCNDLSMRAMALKARQLIGVNVPESESSRSYLPRGGMTAR